MKRAKEWFMLVGAVWRWGSRTDVDAYYCFGGQKCAERESLGWRSYHGLACDPQDQEAIEVGLDASFCDQGRARRWTKLRWDYCVR